MGNYEILYSGDIMIRRFTENLDPSKRRGAGGGALYGARILAHNFPGKIILGRIA